jgi:hypothetical protein
MKDKQTLSQEVSLVSHTVKQGKGSHRKTKGIYGMSAKEPLAKYDPDTHSLRTSQGCLPLNEGDSSTEFYRTWQKSGMMRNGVLFRQAFSVRHIEEKESGLFPTPTKSDLFAGNLKSSQQTDGSMHSVTLPQYIQRLEKLFPTPNKWDGKRGPLSEAEMMTGEHQTSLTTYIKHLPKKIGTPRKVTMDILENRGKGNLEDMIGGVLGFKLRSTFVEWMMGYPEAWTKAEKTDSRR